MIVAEEGKVERKTDGHRSSSFVGQMISYDPFWILQHEVFFVKVLVGRSDGQVVVGTIVDFSPRGF